MKASPFQSLGTSDRGYGWTISMRTHCPIIDIGSSAGFSRRRHAVNGESHIHKERLKSISMKEIHMLFILSFGKVDSRHSAEVGRVLTSLESCGSNDPWDWDSSSLFSAVSQTLDHRDHPSVREAKRENPRFHDNLDPPWMKMKIRIWIQIIGLSQRWKLYINN